VFLDGLQKDPHQKIPGNDSKYLVALAVNYMHRQGCDADSHVVPLVQFARTIGRELSDLLQTKDGDREISVPMSVRGETDFYVKVADLHLLNLTPQLSWSVNELATHYSRHRDSQSKNLLAAKCYDISERKAEKWSKVFPLEKEELLSSMLLEVISLMERYVPEKASFTTYLGYRLEGMLKELLREKSCISRRDFAAMQILEYKARQHENKSGSQPGYADMCRIWDELALDSPKSSIYFRKDAYDRHMVRTMTEKVSLDAVTENALPPHIDPSPETFAETTDYSYTLAACIDRDMQKVPQQYRDAMRSFLSGECSMMECANMLGRSESRFSQIVAKYLKSENHFRNTRKHLGIDMSKRIVLDI
jgi:RNA polymerase sigma factor (sigma-70 family)